MYGCLKDCFLVNIAINCSGLLYSIGVLVVVVNCSQAGRVSIHCLIRPRLYAHGDDESWTVTISVVCLVDVKTACISW